jgi:hypothetical protein
LSYLNGSDSNSAQPLSAPLKPAFSPSGCQSRAEGRLERRGAPFSRMDDSGKLVIELPDCKAAALSSPAQRWQRQWSRS